MKTFKVLGLLMSYPRPEWVSHLEECKQLLAFEIAESGLELVAEKQYAMLRRRLDV